MNKFLVSLLLLLLSVSFLYSNGIAETEQYPVQFSDEDSSPELLVNRNGDMHLFYIAGLELVQEVKKDKSDNFVIVNHNLFDNEKIDKIESLNLSRNSSSLLVFTKDGLNNSVYLLRFFDENLEKIKLVDNAVGESIEDFRIIENTRTDYLIAYKVNEVLYLKSYNDNEDINIVVSNDVSHYKIDLLLLKDKFIYHGFIIKNDLSINYFTFNNIELSFLLLDDNVFSENLHVTLMSNPLNQNRILISKKYGYEIYQIDDLLTNYKSDFVKNIYDSYSIYFEDDLIKSFSYKDLDGVLYIDESNIVEDVRKYLVLQDTVYYITKDNLFYKYCVLDGKVSVIFLGS
ncbi:hypothetical protein EW093_05630 [Thiospirochaeta perfilievii]|uniref:Uncharacterized protein n=1 Tax=Thiospirochaeta perfilievii TaxID=252967 RepID=A0A5C1QBV1_9SPIO|nr:hypothetical protein [Thiospirochaeta perfilievii]QEN04206.1 hypothetical protein EW093_05630 [Thiospirochaeta perfilievii]